MNLKWIISCIAIIGFISTGKAQESPRIGLQYSIGIPTGNLDDYIEGTSFRGFLLEFMVFTGLSKVTDQIPGL